MKYQDELKKYIKFGFVISNLDPPLENSKIAKLYCMKGLQKHVLLTVNAVHKNIGRAITNMLNATFKIYENTGLTPSEVLQQRNELLEACRASKAIFDSQGINENHRIVGDQYKLIIKALKL